MLANAWTYHSKTIVGLAMGLATIAGSFPFSDRIWDMGCVVGGSLFAIGLNGLWDIFFREVARPEE